MATTTLPGVELMRTGIWNSSVGATPITPDDLQSMVAAYHDKIVDHAALKVGHTDTRFRAADGDGEPALGWVENLTVSADGNTLTGDITGIPAKFAEIAKTAFRRRSAEIDWNVKSPSGRTYKAVLTGLALLGIQKPAVKGLADVMALFAEDPSELEGTGTTVVMFGDGDTPPVPPVPAPPTDRDVQCTACGAPPIQGGAAVAANQNMIREALGLPADASPEQVTAALTEAGLAAAPVEDDAATKAAAEAKAAEDKATADKAAADAAAAKSAPDAAPVTQVDSAQFAEMQTSYADMQRQLGEINARNDTGRRDSILDTAVRAGKVHPLNVTHFRELLNSDEKGTTTLLESMPPIMPVTEVGHADFAATGPTSKEQIDADAAALGLEF